MLPIAPPQALAVRFQYLRPLAEDSIASVGIISSTSVKQGTAWPRNLRKHFLAESAAGQCAIPFSFGIPSIDIA
jgi:hypothetical protein